MTATIMLVIFGSITLILWRELFNAWLRNSRLREQIAQRVAIVGWTQDAAEIVAAIHKDRYHPYDIIGLIATHSPSSAVAAPTLPFLGHIDRLENAISTTSRNTRLDHKRL